VVCRGKQNRSSHQYGHDAETTGLEEEGQGTKEIRGGSPGGTPAGAVRWGGGGGGGKPKRFFATDG